MKLYVKSSKDTDSAIATLRKMPQYLAGGIILLSTVLNKERCGNTSDYDEAEEYVISRTVNNKHSKRSKDAGTVDLVHDIFDYVRKNNIPISKLIQMASCWERYSSYRYYKSGLSDSYSNHHEWLRDAMREARKHYNIKNY